MPPAHRIELPNEVLDQIDHEGRAFVMLSAAFRSIEDDKEATVRLLRYAQHRWGAPASVILPHGINESPHAEVVRDPDDARDASGAF